MHAPDANRQMFDRLAPLYDRMNRILSLGLDRRWRKQAVQALAPRAGECLLDLGCGTGGLAREVLRQCPQATVVGVDPAAGMLAVAREEAAEAGLGRALPILVADAAALPFADAAFDGVVSAFLLRNLADRPRAFPETRRVLKPGGRAVHAELTRPTGPLLRLGHRLYTACLVPLLGRVLARRAAAYRYLAESIRAFPRADTVLEEMAGAGFVGCRTTRLTGGIVTLFIARVAAQRS